MEEGIFEGILEGGGEGTPEGILEGEGSIEGTGEGEGVVEGIVEGTPEGFQEGLVEGEGIPEGEGIIEGAFEGEGVVEGTTEGATEGEGVLEGTPEGISEGEGETPYHSADPNGDWVINLSELLRVIQFFNYGGYHCETGTEDGYAPGLEGDHTCHFHSSDYNGQDWTISLSELLRLIQFFNFGGYHVCSGGEDGYCPGQ